MYEGASQSEQNALRWQRDRAINNKLCKWHPVIKAEIVDMYNQVVETSVYSLGHLNF